MPQNLQNEVPDLMATMPLSTSSNTNASELNNNPLRTLSQELVPVPFKSMSIGGGMFSTTSSGTLFGGPKSMPPPSSSSLQLSSNNSTGFNYFQDNKNLGLVSGSAHMSATALLQKAAQMGATASNNSINSPMMQKSFVTTMAGPDQVSSPRQSPYSGGAMQPHNPSYDHFNLQPDQSHMAGVSSGGGGGGAFTNQFFHKGPQEMPLIFDASNTSTNNGSTMNDMGMFSTMFMGSDHNTGLMKNNVEQEVGTSSSLVHGRDLAEGNNPMGPPRFGGSDMTTVHDFLGVGGSTSRAGNLHEPQKHHQQQRMELEALSHQRLPLINQFHHHLPHGDSAMEKSIWDI